MAYGMDGRLSDRIECPNCGADYLEANGGWRCASCRTTYCTACNVRGEPANSVLCPNCNTRSTDAWFNISINHG